MISTKGSLGVSDLSTSDPFILATGPRVITSKPVSNQQTTTWVSLHLWKLYWWLLFFFCCKTSPFHFFGYVLSTACVCGLLHSSSAYFTFFCSLASPICSSLASASSSATTRVDISVCVMFGEIGVISAGPHSSASFKLCAWGLLGFSVGGFGCCLVFSILLVGDVRPDQQRYRWTQTLPWAVAEAIDQAVLSLETCTWCHTCVTFHKFCTVNFPRCQCRSVWHRIDIIIKWLAIEITQHSTFSVCVHYEARVSILVTIENR